MALVLHWGPAVNTRVASSGFLEMKAIRVCKKESQWLQLFMSLNYCTRQHILKSGVYHINTFLKIKNVSNFKKLVIFKSENKNQVYIFEHFIKYFQCLEYL